MNLTETLLKIKSLTADIAATEAAAKERVDGLRRQVADLRRLMALDGALLDADKIALARTIIYVRGSYANGGEDRGSVISDAVQFFVSGPQPYKNLRREYFGTKNYAHWQGQRVTCEYGMGPSHGSVCFEVGMTGAARKRETFTSEEVEACLYLLTRLEAIQSAEAAAKAAA